MRVSNRLISVAIISFAISLMACSKGEQAESVIVQSSKDCLNQAIENQFVVKWKNGTVSVESGRSREQFIEEFIKPNLEKIERVEHDFRIQVEPFTKLTEEVHTLGSFDNWGVRSTGAESAWVNDIRGANITVAVVDTGVDTFHQQLAGRIAQNSGETGIDDEGFDKRFNGLDDDNNGYVDDYAGYDFVKRSGSISDDLGHGTHIAGIVSAEHTDDSLNSNYVQGIAPKAEILPVDFIDRSDGGSTSLAVEGINYAVSRGARIINASWGGSVCSLYLGERIQRLSQESVLFVAAAGNQNMDIDQFKIYPASFYTDSQINVGSLSVFGGMADHSNYGRNTVHLFAPGVNIVSTVPSNGYSQMSGTSMATPFVAAAAALLMSHRPQATVEQIRQAIFTSVQRNSGFYNVTQGSLDIASAIDALEHLVP